MMGAGAGILEAERLRGDGKFPAPELMMRRRGAGELPLLARSAKVRARLRPKVQAFTYLP